jgi:hypothetical protein
VLLVSSIQGLLLGEAYGCVQSRATSDRTTISDGYAGGDARAALNGPELARGRLTLVDSLERIFGAASVLDKMRVGKDEMLAPTGPTKQVKEGFPSLKPTLVFPRLACPTFLQDV